MKKMLALMLTLALLFSTGVCAEEELTWVIKPNSSFIDFPMMDEWHARFVSVSQWTIVTPETLDEHWELVAARGDPEEEIRARYAEPTFLFEAYAPYLPQDVCFRAEVFENEATRDIWHFRHWNGEERDKIDEYLTSGRLIPNRDIYSLARKQSGANAFEQGFFTNYPPTTHESGRIRLHMLNGRLYVFSYAATGRFLGAGRWDSAKEEAAYRKTPINNLDSVFRGEVLPRMPKYELNTVIPEIAEPGVMTFSGIVEAGSKVSAALDGQMIPANVDKNGHFTVDADLSVGERRLTITAEKSKFTTRVMEYTIQVSDVVTPLSITKEPHWDNLIGDVTIAGQTIPGAQLSIILDGAEPVLVVADEGGSFTHAMHMGERGRHTLSLSAQAEGMETSTFKMVFNTDYKDANEGIKAFSKELTENKFPDICANVEEYIGERVKISVRTKEVTFDEYGLGVLCTYNAPSGKKEDEIPLYVTVPGYAQCKIGEKMIITFYGTVAGTRVLFDTEGKEEERVEIIAEYGTYQIIK